MDYYICPTIVHLPEKKTLFINLTKIYIYYFMYLSQYNIVYLIKHAAKIVSLKTQNLSNY